VANLALPGLRSGHRPWAVVVHSQSGSAEEQRADLIIVGSTGLNALAGHLLGSVPGDVARRAPCDVLIVQTTQAVGQERLTA